MRPTICPADRLPRPGETIFTRVTSRSRPDYVVDENGCWVWQKSTLKGYAVSGAKRVYRLYYERANGPIPDGFHVHHVCRNPTCINPGHLEAKPAEDHWAEHGLERRVLTVEDGQRMRELACDNTLTYDEIAAEFGVSYQYVYEVALGRRFKEISDQPVELPDRVCANRHCSNDTSHRRRQARFCCTKCQVDEYRWSTGIVPTPSRWRLRSDEEKAA